MVVRHQTWIEMIDRAQKAEARVAELERVLEFVDSKPGVCPVCFVSMGIGLPHGAMCDLGRAIKRTTHSVSEGQSFETMPAPIAVRQIGGADGPWRLFVNDHGVATWPSHAAHEDPRGYAEEVARCLRKALWGFPVYTPVPGGDVDESFVPLSKYILDFFNNRNRGELSPAIGAMSADSRDRLIGELSRILRFGGHPPNWVKK